jgi:Bacterial RNA polymerase, alpha chain C terminal domain
MTKGKLLLPQFEISPLIQDESVSETAESVVAASVPDWHSAPIEVLSLSVRPYNALKRSGLATLGDVVAFLEDYQTTGTKSVRNIGPQSIVELQDELARYLRQPKYKPLIETAFALVSPHRRTSPPNKSALARCQELQKTLADEISRKRLHVKAILDDRPVSDWLDLDSASIDEFVLKQIDRSFEQALVNQTVCDELTKLFADISIDRIEIFYDRMGPKKHTLEEIGKKRRLTRERIRQIAEKVENRISVKLSLDHYVRIQSSLLIAEDMGSGITYSEWVRQITSVGLLGSWDAKTIQYFPERINPAGLMLAICGQQESSTACSSFKIPENLRIAMTSNRSNVSPETIKMISDVSKQTVRSIRKEAKNGGAVHVPSVAKKLNLTLDQTQRVLSEWGYKQITSDWYMLRPRKRAGGFDQTWAVFHTVLKMSKFCGPLESVAELGVREVERR